MDETSIARTLEEGVRRHQSGQLAEAETCYRNVLRSSPAHPDALYLLGTIQHARGNLGSAALFLQKAIEFRPGHADAENNLGLVRQAQGDLDAAERLFRNSLKRREHWQVRFNLANVLRSRRKYGEAIRCYRRTLQLNPKYAPAYDNLALAHRAQGDLKHALRCSDQAVQADPTLAIACNTRGAILCDLGRVEEAAGSFDAAVELNPDFIEARFNLAKMLFSTGRLESAVTHLTQVVQRRPEHADALHLLGLTLHNLGEDAKATECYFQAIRLRPQFADAFNNLGTSLCRLGQWDDAIDCYRQAVQSQPTHLLGWKNLGSTLEQRGHHSSARQAYRKAIEIDGKDALLRLRAACVCDTVVEDADQIVRHRAELFQELRDLASRRQRFTFAELVASDVRPSFNLQFHGENERPLREAFAEVFSPSFDAAPLEIRRSRPKVGFVVTHGHHYAFCRSIGAMLQQFSDAIQPVVVCSAADAKRIREKLGNDDIEVCVLPADHGQCPDAIRAGNFDILHYWEVATGALNYYLPYLRLAPVQLTSWGIQVTSGVPNMDYYVSSRLIETPDAQEHYSEKLLLLDTMLSYQIAAKRPAAVRPREHFGLSPDKNLYLCAQHLGKFHPDFDEILAEILRTDPRGEIVITQGKQPWVASRLQERFERRISDVASRIRFLPQQSGDDYYSLLINADVLLDPLHFGGVNTTYDGLSFGKPIVTLPSPYHRGRYTQGCYRAMGVGLEECVASSTADYVRKAVRLADDGDFSRSLSDKMLDAKGRIFENRRSSEELEELFLRFAADA